MMQVMLENQRADREAQRERDRLDREREREQRERDRELDRERERAMIGPREFIEMTEKLRSTSGVDTVMKQMTEVFGTMFGMMRSQVEMMQQMNGSGQPNPIIEAIGTVAGPIKDMAQGYYQMQAQKATAEAQARAFEARARAPEAFPQPGAPAQAQAAAGPGGKVIPMGPRAVPDAPAEAAASQADPQPQTADPNQPWGSSDEERALFGLPIVLKQVENLRQLVAEGKADPTAVVNWVRYANAEITKQGARKFVKVLDLYDQQIYDDFCRVILPQAPATFIQALVQLMASTATTPGIIGNPAVAAPPPEEENDEDEDEDDDVL
jgi:hypothetical protein